MNALTTRTFLARSVISHVRSLQLHNNGQHANINNMIKRFITQRTKRSGALK